MKTLYKLLSESKYQKCNVKIGSNKGSGFWYCGKGNFALSLNHIIKANEKLKESSQKELNRLLYRQANLDYVYEESLNTFIKNSKKKKRYIDLDKKKEELTQKKENERKSLPSKIKSIEYDINTDLLDRPVVEVVEGISPDEMPCWVIYIKGNEKGNYWTIAEYEKRERKRNGKKK